MSRTMPYPLREAGCSRRERREYGWPPLPFLEPIPAHESDLLEAGTRRDIGSAPLPVKHPSGWPLARRIPKDPRS